MFLSVCAISLAAALTIPQTTSTLIWAAPSTTEGTVQSAVFSLAEDKNTAGMKGLWKDIAPEESVKGSNTYQIQVKSSNPAINSETVSWQSSDSSIASVNTQGIVTGHKLGHADITATYGGYSQKFGINVVVPADEPYTISNGVLSYSAAALGKKYHLSVNTTGNVKWNGPVASGTQNMISISGGSGSNDLYLSENVPCTFSTTPSAGKTSKFSLVPAEAGKIESVAGDPGKVAVTLYAPATLEVSEADTVFATKVKAMDDFVMKTGEKVTLTANVTPPNATVQPTWKYEEQSSFWAHYTPGLDTDFAGAVDFDGTTVTAKAPGVANFTVSAAEKNGKTTSDSLQIKVVDQSTRLFDDIRNMEKYYFQPVYWAVDKNITSGTSSNLFSPEQEVKRGQMVTFLWRTAGSPAPDTTNNPFSDVDEGSPYYQAILWAYQKGITKGITDTTFEPGKTCTRAQIVSFLYNYEGKPSTSGGRATKFTDISQKSYYYDAVDYAVSKNITAGISATVFGTDQTCTRGQAMTFLYRSQNQK